MRQESSKGREDLRAREERAVSLAESPELLSVFDEAIRDESVRKHLSRDAEGLLHEKGIDLPEGLGVNFIQEPGAGIPVPDYEFFTIRLTRCRTVWVPKRDKDGRITGYEEQTYCLGFEIIPHPLPPIA